MLVLFWLVIHGAAASPKPATLERVLIAGQNYVRCSDWATREVMRLSWQSGQKDFALTNQTHRLQLTLNSRRAVLNGVMVWLSWPVQLWRDVPHLSDIDVRTLLDPLLHPRRDPSGKGLRRVMLDPGHGGKDPGNVSGTRKEKAYTLLFAHDVRLLLQKAGLKVKLTRTDDRFVDLEERPALARSWGADLLVSLHFNSGPDARGSEVFCMPPAGVPVQGRSRSISERGWPGNLHDAKNVLAAYQVQKALVQRARMDDRGVRRERFVVLREATVPAVLVEAAFMTDSEDARKISDLAERKRLAKAVADGILAYSKLVEGPRK